MKKKRQARNVRVRAEHSAPFFFITGKRGGWFISLTWNHSAPLQVSWNELRRLFASSKGDVVIARRMVGGELRFFEQYRDDINREVHARLIYKDAMRWRSLRKR